MLGNIFAGVMFRCLLFLLLFSWSIHTTAQSIQLRVVDEAQVPLVGATISSGNDQLLITDAAGAVIIKCGCDSLEVLIRHVGYGDVKTKLSMATNQVVTMVSADIEMDELVISARSEQALLEQASSIKAFDMEEVSHLPYLLGERDPIKFIQTQTGVSTGTDGNNGYYVRGGGIDQNAIELDHMEFYNTNHLFGFFSMFSAEAIDRAEFLKAGYPAHVGGRLSSTLKLYTKDPDLQDIQGSVSLGLLAASASIQAPVVKGKSGVLLAYRRSYLDLITQNFLPVESDIRRSTNYRFSDALLKYQHRINKAHTLSLTAFTGGDFYDFQSSKTFSNLIDWSNWNVGLTLNSILNERSDLTFFVNGGRFKQNFQANISSFGIDLHSDIQNLKAGLLVHHHVGAHELAFGLQWIQRRFKPSQVDIIMGQSVFALDESELIYTSEWAFSMDDSWEMTEQLRLGLGLRVSGFLQWGPFSRYVAEESVIVDTLSFASGKVVSDYIGWEPRIRLSYLLNEYASVKLSYDRTYQYIHLSPLSSVSLPTDLWVPSTSRVQPQNAHQITLGYFRVLEALGLHGSAEVFGKLLHNQVEWQNGAIAGYSDSPNFDDDFIFGKGHSYGLELSLSRQAGRVSGEVNYTLSRTKRRFAAVNGGDYFPAKYDRIHDLNVVGSVKLGRWTLSGLFKLASGTALTLPTAKYLIGERVISEYSRRNALRMPMYHRMDVSAVWKPLNHPSVTWAFSVYNMYNRRNPYFVYFDVQGDVDDYSLDIDLEEVSLFPVLPAISYQLSF